MTMLLTILIWLCGFCLTISCLFALFMIGSAFYFMSKEEDEDGRSLFDAFIGYGKLSIILLFFLWCLVFVRNSL